MSKNIGTTELSVKYKYSLFSKKIKIKIENVSINDINLGEDLVIKTNESIRLKPVINNNENIISNLVYESENNNIAKVDTYGNITSINPGTTSINIIGKNNITKKVNVKVESTIKPINKISLTESNISLKKGEKVKLIPVIEPIDATDTNITWTSSNENVVTVNNGKVLGKKKGNATITVKTSSNKTDTCNIVIK